MAMKICKECGTEMSKSAKICPKCGKDQRNFFLKHKVMTFILVVIMLGIIVGATGDSSSNKTTVTGTTGKIENNKNQEVKDTPTTVKVGEEISTDQEKISFKSAKDYTGYNSYSKPKSGNKIIRVEFGFENISDSDIILSNFECYADGEKSDEYYYAKDYKNSTLENLSKGKKMTAVLYYEVPKNAKSIVLEYETNFWTDRKVEFIVK